MVKIIYNSKLLSILTFYQKGIVGITLWPFILLRDDQRGNDILLNHELIHIQQQRELYVIGFYILYGYYYIRNRIRGMYHSRAYRLNPFEVEAYKFEHYPDYLITRPKYSWKDYVEVG